MNTKKFFGAVFLIAGTTIGVGMLGMPVVTGFTGFFPSLLVFGLCWGFMLLSALFFVDINSHFQKQVNLITMAGKTVGNVGKALSWVVYLLLLYALMVAYISAVAPLFQQAIEVMFHSTLPLWICQFGLPLIFGGLIYFGIRYLDLINQFFMFGLILAYAILVMFLPEKVSSANLLRYDFRPFFYGFPVVITGFGYHIIIPSLYSYLDGNKKALRNAVITGSLFALILNLFWQLLILGILPLKGDVSIFSAWVSNDSIPLYLERMVDNMFLRAGIYFFSFFAIITSFLGVSLSLSDFLMDGFQIKKTWEGKLSAILLTFIPPLIIVYSSADIFLRALNYAGAFVAILLIFLPSWMVLSRKFHHGFITKFLAGITIAFSFGIIVINLLIRLGFFQNMLMSVGGSA